MLREDSIEGLRRRARRRLPRMVFDFIDGGAESETTLRRNCEALSRIALVPNCFRAVENRNLQVSILGRPASMPVMVGPTGLAALVWPHADQLLAQAAQRAGVPFVVSTSSSARLEDIAAAAPSARLWMQVYPYRDRELVESLIARAAACNFEALVLTVDTPVLGHRSRDHANRFSVPIRPTWHLFWDLIRCAPWTLGLARHGVPRMRNFVDYGHGHKLESLAQLMTRNMNPGADWTDLTWLRKAWQGPLILKGVLCAEGARRAAREGVDAIVVSNHGGRQLDGAPATITMLPEIVAAAGTELEIYIDGGIRSGVDVARALASGARSAMIGRATLYGVAAAGAVGANHALELLRTQLDRTLALLGCPDVAELSRIRTVRE